MAVSRHRGAIAVVAGVLVAGVALAAASALGGEDDPSPSGNTGQPASTEKPFEHYVALGDSYTAAPLVPNVDGASGSCFRSTNNYPSLVAEELEPPTFADQSCGGADTTSMTGTQPSLNGGDPVPAQLAALTKDTDLVTLGVGGNDFGVFVTLVNHCPTLRASDPTGSPCRDSMQTNGKDRLLADIDRTEQRIAKVVDEIKKRSPNAEILLIGYPQIVPETGTCPDRLAIAEGDFAYGREVNEALTGALEQAAEQTDTTYVDVWGPSEGHDVCSDDPWVNGQARNPDAAPFHPFAAEQSAVAELVLDTLDED